MARERPRDYPVLTDYEPSKFMLLDSHYDKEKADRAVRFIENLCHTKGRWAGKPFWLLPWQERIVRDIFGIVKEDGTRQFRTAYVEIPKKNQIGSGSQQCEHDNPSNCRNTLKPQSYSVRMKNA